MAAETTDAPELSEELTDAAALIGRQPGRYAISGRLMRSLATRAMPRLTPIAKAVVRAYDMRLRGELALGDATTGVDGRFLIEFAAPADKPVVDLQLRAFDAKNALLVASPVVFSAREVELVELVYQDPSASRITEHERHTALLAPVLAGADIATLTQPEIDFAGEKTGVPKQYVAHLAVANRLGKQLGVVPQALYGLFRTGAPTDASALVLMSQQRITDGLARACDAGIVAAALKTQGAAIASTLHAALASHPATFGLAAVLAASSAPASAQAAFLGLLADAHGDTAALWAAATANPATNAGVAQLQYVVQAGWLARGDLALVKAILGKAGDLRSLLALSVADWKQLALGAGIAAADADARAADLAETVRAALPTAAVARVLPIVPALDAATLTPLLARNPGFDPSTTPPANFDWGVSGDALAKAQAALAALRRELVTFPGAKAADVLAGNNAARADLARFFANVPALELADTVLRSFVASNASALVGVAGHETTLSNLERLQRVYRVTPHPDHAQLLLGEGLDSAHAIATIPRTAFVDDWSDSLGGADIALAYHETATMIDSFTSSIGTAAYQLVDGADDLVDKNGATDAVKYVPTLETLFGSMDTCACSECNSVWGPSAYLVDLLQYLRKSTRVRKQNGDHPYDRLIDRRPDLRRVELTCDNADTPLPMIDIVNEILEFFVVHHAFSSLSWDEQGDLAKNTTDDISADELALAPQYTLGAAYDTLSSVAAARAPALPFSRWHGTARAYLELLGSSRAEVMRTFQHDASNDETALEVLHLTTAQRDLIIGASAQPIYLQYGFASATVGGHSWHKDAAKVETLLRALGIAFDDLVALVETRYLNPIAKRPNPPAAPDPSLIIIYAPDASCDLTKTLLRRYDGGDLGDVTWGRIQGFVRLWRALGWTIAEVDQALVAFGDPLHEIASELTSPLVTRLSRVERLREELSLPVLQLLSMWSPMQTFGTGSLFATLFQNRTVLDPPDAAFDLIASPPYNELAVTTAVASGHLPALLAALRLGAPDLRLLVASLDPTATLDNTTLVIASLSALYRKATLAQALDLSIADILDLADLLGSDPWQDPSATQRFYERATAVANTSFTVATVSYALRGTTRSQVSLRPDEDSVLQLLYGLQDALAKVVEQTTLVPDPKGELLRSKLAMVIDTTRVDDAMAIIAGTSSLSDSARVAFIDANLTFFPDLAAAHAMLDGPASDDATQQARRSYALAALLPYLRDSLSRGVINETLSGALTLPSDLTSWLIETALPSRYGTGTAMTDLRGLIGTGLSATYVAGAQQLQRVDATVDFAWGTGMPAPSLAVAPFTATWTGQLVAPLDETYTFYLTATDDATLTLTIDGAPHALTSTGDNESQLAIALTARTPIGISISYHDTQNRDAAIQLQWSSLSTPKATVPQAQLFASAVAPYDGLVATYIQAQQFALIASGFAMTVAEAVYFAKRGFAPSGLGDTSATFGTLWPELTDYFDLRDHLPSGTSTALDVVTAGSLAAAVPILAQLAGWDPSDASTAATELHLADADFASAAGPIQMRTAFSLARRLGTSVETLYDWATTEPDAAHVRAIVHTAKGHFDDPTWLTIGKPVADTLREKRRDALVAYALTAPELASANLVDSDSLFEYFLIDVNMASCMLTSRIKQAVSSVQLFIQRCFLDLEEGVSPGDLDATWWSWMQSNVIWQANRKVFLYPENWIMPDLRSDKTPFFTDLETQLQQGPLTEANIESAISAYLYKLDAVARMEMCAMYRQKSSDGQPEILHIFARTQNPPHVYYYRTFTPTTLAWTAWQEVQLDIEGEHLIPVVFHGRLFLFWATFDSRSDEHQSMDGPPMDKTPDKAKPKLDVSDAGKRHSDATGASDFIDQIEKLHQAIDGLAQTASAKATPGSSPATRHAHGPTQHYEISLAWAELRDGVWGGKQTSATPLESYAHDGVTLAIEDHFFSVDTSSNLSITCYRRRAVTWDTDTSDYVWIIGRFGLDECRAKLRTHQLDKNVRAPAKGTGTRGTRTTPVGSRLSYQGYRQLEASYGLAFSGPSPQYQIYPLLGTTPTKYMVHQPSERHKPTTSTLTTVVVPFLLHDRYRSYLGHKVQETVYDTPVGPIVPHQWFGVQDPTVSQIENIDPGYPQIDESIAESLVVWGTGEQSMYSGDRDGYSAPATREVIESRLVVETPPDHSIFQEPAELTPELTGHKQSFIKFEELFHAFACDFIEAFDRGGPAELFTLANQRKDFANRFESKYAPLPVVDKAYPKENVDFSGGAYSVYNWELFFHIPLLVASLLMTDQQFSAAKTWLEYIFKPTADAKKSSDYWNVLPFYRNHESGQRIVTMLDSLAPGGDPSERASTLAQISAWRNDPFDPHMLAMMRPAAYEKNVVQTYVQNLIAWGDQQFALNTIEAINEATQLYVFASHLLGQPPVQSPTTTVEAPQNFHQLSPTMDAFSNASVQLETQFPFSTAGLGSGIQTGTADPYLGMTKTEYFCIPPNDQLQTLWDTVADRLFKIRHCMNLEGQVQQLPIWDPPIDPGLLVQAKALGLDLTSVLDDVNSQLGPYRFTALAAKANELCNDVKALGALFLSALEKRDAEALAALRAGQETAVQKAIKDVKKLAVDEANGAIQGLQRSREVVAVRQSYYQSLISGGLNAFENAQLAAVELGGVLQAVSSGMELGASGADQVPTFITGGAGWSSPVMLTVEGGGSEGAALSAAARAVGLTAAASSVAGTLAGIMAGYDRRSQDWAQQLSVATKELAQIDQQIATAQIHLALAQKDLDNQDLLISNSEDIESFLRSKYTNQDLYSWLQAQIARVYFQAYSTAYDLAKRAEKAYRYELGIASSEFINFGYWDSLHKGLLAGERLSFDLKRMEASYLAQNKRELELSKDISLALLAPDQLATLRETGTIASLDLPELLFDCDYLGHYMRRIKTLAVTVPCVVGPYTSVNCTVTQLASSIRVDPSAARAYVSTSSDPDPRFVTNRAASGAIALSHAQADAGLFETNLRDERYLPFEGTGAISTWRIELPGDTASFDPRTISDVILHLRYTARDGGQPLRDLAAASRDATLKSHSPLIRLMSLRHELSNDWYRFLQPSDAVVDPAISIDLSTARFPYLYQRKKVQIDQIAIWVLVKAPYTYTAGANDASTFALSVQTPGGAKLRCPVKQGTTSAYGIATFGQTGVPGTWQIVAPQAELTLLEQTNPPIGNPPTGLVRQTKVGNNTLLRLGPDAIDDVLLLCSYKVS